MTIRISAFTAIAALCLAAPALADGGVRPIADDFRPAVSTQDRLPDGGKRYFPPNTASLLRAQDRTAADREMDEQARQSSRPLPRNAPTDPARQPPNRVGR